MRRNRHTKPTAWILCAVEPWPFLTADASEISGTVTMEDVDGGGSVEVSFEVSCAGQAGDQ